MNAYQGVPGGPRDPARWLPVVGFEGYYAVSDLGGIRSVDREILHPSGSRRLWRGRLLSPTPSVRGYQCVSLHREGVRTVCQVHPLVLTAHVGPRPEGMVACHKDGDPTNNAVNNLRWDTPSSNNLDAVRHGTHVSARKTHCPRGHAYDEANTYVTPAGVRDCRICRKVHLRNSRERRAEVSS